MRRFALGPSIKGILQPGSSRRAQRIAGARTIGAASHLTSSKRPMITYSLRERRHERIEDGVAGQIAHAIKTLTPDNSRLLHIQARKGLQTLLFRDQFTSPERPVIYDQEDERDPAVISETDFVQIDVETATFPAADGHFDLVIWNRELVTVKNVGPALREVHRVLRPEGMLLVAVPNLAALHNRLLLLAGRQPSTLHIDNGDHIRGFVIPSMTRFLERDLGFQVLGITGVGLAPITGAVLPGALRGLSHSAIWILRKPRSSVTGADLGVEPLQY
jgi:SAM-dependent methyltransferase